MRRNVFEMNYARLCTLLGQKPCELAFDHAYRFRAKGYMDLVVERLPDCTVTGAPVLSLCHYFEQNGDLCKDPEMTVRSFEPRAAITYGMIDVLIWRPPLQSARPKPSQLTKGSGRREAYPP